MIINFTRPAIIAKQLTPKNELLRKDRLDYLTIKPSVNAQSPISLKKKRKKEQLIIWSVIGLMITGLILASYCWS